MKLKHFILYWILLSFPSVSTAQLLQQGVYSSITLSTDVRPWNLPTGCPPYTIFFYSNCLPYVTGMDLYLKIDSIKGTSDSIQIYRNPDYLMTFVTAGDSIVINSINSISVFLGLDTLYSSLIAAGTPQVAGESYYCNYKKSLLVNPDGCIQPFLSMHFAGGNGPLDTIKSCSVLGPSAFNDLTLQETIVYPNPFSSLLSISHNNESGEIQVNLYNIVGEIVFRKTIVKDIESMDLEFLNQGTYLLELVQNNKRQHSLLIKTNSQ